MKKMNKFVSAALVASLASPAMATDMPDWLKVDTEINVDVNAKKSNDYDPSLGFYMQVRTEAAITESVRAVVTMALWRGIVESGRNSFDENDKLEFERMMTEAYIQVDVDKVTGLPWATVLLGKQYLWSYGQNYSEMPNRWGGLMDKLGEGEVIGATLALTPKFYEIVDFMAVSVYETGRGDLDISDKMGVSAKASKQITDEVRAQVSALIKENEGFSDKESRVSVGLIYKSDMFNAWGEIVALNNSPIFPEAKIAGVMGIAKQIGIGNLAGEVTVVGDTATEYGVGYTVPVYKNVTVGPEIRHIDYRDGIGKDDTKILVKMQYTPSAGSAKKPLVKKKKNN